MAIEYIKTKTILCADKNPSGKEISIIIIPIITGTKI
jgi:hypothetical protein